MKNPYYAAEGLVREDGTPYKPRQGYNVATADDVSWGEDIAKDLKRRGYDGIIDGFADEPIDEDSIFNLHPTTQNPCFGFAV